MSKERTPSTRGVRSAYLRVWNGSIEGANAETVAAEFDTWLNQVKADAWDEGANALEHHQMHVSGGWPNNPYRKQEEA